MSIYLDRARTIRADKNYHHNCAESIVLTFSEETGINQDIARKITSNFGKGMKMASICGVMTGGLMVLGLFGINDQETINRYIFTFKKNHEGAITCAELLRMNYALGLERKRHCDRLVYESVQLLEDILREKGCIQ